MKVSSAIWKFCRRLYQPNTTKTYSLFHQCTNSNPNDLFQSFSPGIIAFRNPAIHMLSQPLLPKSELEVHDVCQAGVGADVWQECLGAGAGAGVWQAGAQERDCLSSSIQVLAAAVQ